MLIDSPGPATANRKIPSGYTYLGQFIDHDVTFDPTSSLDPLIDVGRLVNFRTPRLDLDSLYGTGPSDQPFLYDWTVKPEGVKLLVEHRSEGTADLPRNSQGRALIGDPRNDENLIISQLHLLFINFHNKVVGHLLGEGRDPDDPQLFEAARERVRRHYHWIVADDFLPRVVGADMARDVLDLGPPPQTDLQLYKSGGEPFMPLEFSGAAYRFGHSMVRANYVFNDPTRAVSIFRPDGGSNSDEPRFGALSRELEINWDHFFDVASTPPVNDSMRIDPFLVAPLRRVATTGLPLAWLNLLRGTRLQLRSGFEVAQEMEKRGLTLQQLTEEQLLEPIGGGKARKIIGDALLQAPPLWYYMLCEAMYLGDGGQQLGPLGGRIVAEVLVGLLQDDPDSWLKAEPLWRPQLAGPDGQFKMADLVRFTRGG